MWQLEFFEHASGRCLVADFLESLHPEIDRPYIRNAFTQLEEHGNNLRRPIADFLEDGIYELRVSTRTGRFRFLYFFDKQTIVVTHGFQKQKTKAPRNEIELAKKYRKIYYERKLK